MRLISYSNNTTFTTKNNTQHEIRLSSLMIYANGTLWLPNALLQTDIHIAIGAHKRPDNKQSDRASNYCSRGLMDDIIAQPMPLRILLRKALSDRPNVAHILSGGSRFIHLGILAKCPRENSNALNEFANALVHRSVDAHFVMSIRVHYIYTSESHDKVHFNVCL